MQAVELRRVAATATAPQWIVDGLIPRGYVTLLFGRAGSGKTFLHLWIAAHVATGLPVFGRRTAHGRVLILDGELSANDIAYRAVQVARGMALDAPPAGLFYYRLENGLTASREGLRRMVGEVDPTLIVIDSLSAAAPGSDPNEATAVRAVFNELTGLGRTVLAIDHVPKSAMSGGGFPAPLGSVSKENVMRSGIYVSGSANGIITLQQTKSTFGARDARPLSLAAEFTPTSYRLVPVVAQFDGARRESTEARVLTLLAETPAGMNTSALAKTLNISKKTIMNRMGELQNDGKVVRAHDGKWLVA